MPDDDAQTVAPTSSGVDDQMERLERIADLKERGIIDDDEAKRLRDEVWAADA